jgi:hypothetical protein
MMTLILQMQVNGHVFQNMTPVNRGIWDHAEDDLLTAAVRRLGSKKWVDIAKLVPNRTPKQCRERWCNHLAPSVRHEPFAPWEDQLIMDKQRELGNRWSSIARHLEGRSANAVKNRWYSGLKSSREAAPLADFGQSLSHEPFSPPRFPRGEYRDQGPLGADL